MKKLLGLVLTLVVLTLPASCTCGDKTQTYTIPIGGEGELNLYGIDPLTLDPALAGDSTSNNYILQIFSGLVRLDDTLTPVPDLAQSWVISPDGKTYTFTLRQDVFFQNGRQLTAEDLKYSWERACNPATASQTAATYLGDIAGADEMLAGLSATLSGVEVVDTYTLRVELKSPRSYFLAKLSYVTSFVVDREQAEGNRNWWQTPNGTGPFRFYSWEPGNQFVLQRNPLYYGEQARLASVVFHLWAGVPMNMYELGDLDVAEVDLSYYDRLVDEAGPFLAELVITPVLDLTYLGFNCTVEPFNDPLIRQAFSKAVNKEKIVKIASRGTQNAAYGVLPEGMPGSNEWLLGLNFDVEAARRLIADSSYGSIANLPPIVVTVGGYGGLVNQEMEAIINEWRLNLGVEVTVRQLEPQEYYYNLIAEKDQLFYWGWGADYAHPQNFLEILFATGSLYNTGEYSNAAFDALMIQAGEEQDYALSMELYRQAEEILVRDAACLPLWSNQTYTLVKPYVKGYAPSSLGAVALNRVYLEY
jgi:oligopeptide transport system substrate-binding protein